jgi:hypothetical protein
VRVRSDAVTEKENVESRRKELEHDRFSLAVGKEMISSAGANHNGAARVKLKFSCACDAIGSESSLWMLVPKGDCFVDHTLKPP